MEVYYLLFILIISLYSLINILLIHHILFSTIKFIYIYFDIIIFI
jgi:hypothetical protein